MFISIDKPLTVYTDNNQARTFSTSTCLRSRLRGVFSLHEAWVQELKDGGWMEAKYVAADNNAANILTKPLAAGDYRRERRLIGARWALIGGVV